VINTVILRFEALLQSWGEQSHWDERKTNAHPTKSAVAGIIAAAMGIDRREYLGEICNNITMGVRIDRKGVLISDFHTVGGGHPDSIILSAENKKKYITGKPYTVISQRWYLADASFAVSLQSEDGALLQDIKVALMNPKWNIYLGRKCCVPSLPVFESTGKYNNLLSSLFIKEKPHVYVLECNRTQPGAVRHWDSVDSFGNFAPRYTYTFRS